MKKNLLLIAGLFFTFGIANAQFDINVEGSSSEISGADHTINTLNVNGLEVDFEVHNVGNADNYKITRSRLDVPASWTDYLCWGEEGDQTGGNCYGASQMNGSPWTTPDVINLGTGSTGILLVHVDPDDNVYGTAHYRYYIGRTADNPLDSVDLIVSTSQLGVKVIKSPSATLAVYPNPVADFMNVTVNTNSTDNVLRITDVLGKEVYEEKISGSKKIDTEAFKNGVYVVTLTSNGTTYTKRIVVKH
ncbi:MAG: hypothetical protein K0R65_994 [Crocinitomicaceae bacterium]|jgi:hypothetical protein|nr:hypothetical protein [Crocinitomicaceae bacterium]